MPVVKPSTNAWTRRTEGEPRVVILDPVTSQPVAEERQTPPPEPPAAELLNAEHEMPDGAPAVVHERRTLPLVVSILAIGGLVVVGTIMYLVDGLEAMFVGLTWVILAYSVSWIAVWAAGLLRARDEKAAEDEVCRRRAGTNECEDAHPPTVT